MSDYIATVRSNYFKVKDGAAYRQSLSPFRLSLFEDLEKRQGFAATIHGGLLAYDLEGMRFSKFLAPHLVEGEVAVIEEAGNEKYRYVCGFAVAINHKGEELHLSLADIYEKVRLTWGQTVFENTTEAVN